MLFRHINIFLTSMFRYCSYMDNRGGEGVPRSFEGWRTQIPRFISRSRCKNEVQLLSPQIKSKSEASCGSSSGGTLSDSWYGCDHMNYLTSVQVDELCNLTITLFYSPCGMRIISDENYPYTFKMYIATYSKKRICQGRGKTENLQLPAANVYFSSIRPTYLFVVMFFTTCRTEIIVPL